MKCNRCGSKDVSPTKFCANCGHDNSIELPTLPKEVEDMLKKPAPPSGKLLDAKGNEIGGSVLIAFIAFLFVAVFGIIICNAVGCGTVPQPEPYRPRTVRVTMTPEEAEYWDNFKNSPAYEMYFHPERR
jgi:uncharacterized OB-fold protein